MKLGVNLAYWGLGPGAEEQLEIARTAEALGYDSLWIAEAYGSDAPSIMGWLAQATTRINLGSAVWQIPGRSAAMTAMTAATLDHLSNGRLILGLGTSGPQVAEGWHGQRFEKPIAWTRDYVAIVRKALTRERLTYQGSMLHLPLPDGPGKALKLMIGPVQERIPILLAALGPQNVALAGEIADGWLPIFFSPEHVEELREPLEGGAAKAGRSLDGFRICPGVNTFITDDLELGRNLVRPVIALYVGGMGSREKNFYNRVARSYGFDDAAQKIQDLYLAGRKDEAANAVPDDLIDLVSLVGPEERVRERLAAFGEAGIDTLIIAPMTVDPDEAKRQLELVAQLAP